MSADISDAETEAAVDSAELAGMAESNPELEVMPDLLEEGREIAGRYRIIRHLGSGGMGNVYLAEHTAIAKQVALKTLSLEYAKRRILRERFLREARSASQIRHPNVVDITDFGSTEEGAPFIAMEFLDGEDLGQTLEREGRLPFERAREIAVQICRALQAAHDKGIVHRDVKPANCFRIAHGGAPDTIKVVDFGIAKTTAASADSTELTKTGVIIGTAAYMAPEQARGDSDVDPRADVYSVGVILFRMLTGEMPYRSKTPLGMITKHLTDPIPSLREVAPDAELSEAVDALVAKALAKDREDRWQSAAELADALMKVEELELTMPIVATPVADSGSSKRGLWVGAGLAAAALGVGLAFVFLGPGQSDEAEAASDEPGESDQVTVEAEARELPPESSKVSVVLLGAPEGAKVFIGEQEIGPANEPFELAKSSETVSLRVRAPGYVGSSVAVVPLADLEVPVTLVAAPEPEPEPTAEPEPEPDPDPKKRRRPRRKKPAPEEPKIDKEIGF